MNFYQDALQWKLVEVCDDGKMENLCKEKLEPEIFLAFLLIFSPFSTRWIAAVCSCLSASIHHFPQLTENHSGEGDERRREGKQWIQLITHLYSTYSLQSRVHCVCLEAGAPCHVRTVWRVADVKHH